MSPANTSRACSDAERQDHACPAHVPTSEASPMKLKSCVECGALGPSTRCELHPRGTTTERGYGWSHQQQLEDPEYLAATHCTNCGDPFTEDNPKQGGHVVPIREGGQGGDPVAPHCRRCNAGWRRTGL